MMQVKASSGCAFTVILFPAVCARPQVDLPRISYMGASPPAYYLFCTLVPLATLTVRAPLLNHLRASKRRLEALLWQLGPPDAAGPDDTTAVALEGGARHNNAENHGGVLSATARARLLRPSALRAVCCGCGWQRCCCGCCWAIDGHRAPLAGGHPNDDDDDDDCRREKLSPSTSSRGSTAPVPAVAVVAVAPLAAVHPDATSATSAQAQAPRAYARPPCCGRGGACGVRGIFCGLGFKGLYLPHALAALVPLFQAGTTGLPLLAIVSVEW
jgi:hypothetical protein